MLLACVIIVVTRRLEDSRIGRAWKAIREDEIAAAAMGIPVVRMKLLGFAVGASFASAVGVLFAAKQVFINPESFTFMESIGVLAMVILGGMGSMPGAILGATGVTILNLQLLKGLSLWLNAVRQSGIVLSIPVLGDFSLSQIPAQFEPAKYERMVFGLILILMMMFRPQGILPPRQKRERPEMALLELRDISKRFGGLQALNRVDLDVGQRHDCGAHRTQRRGQNDALSYPHGYLSSRERRDSFYGQVARRTEAR